MPFADGARSESAIPHAPREEAMSDFSAVSSGSRVVECSLPARNRPGLRLNVPLKPAGRHLPWR